MSTLKLTNAPTTRPRAIGRWVVRLTAVAAATAFSVAIWVIAELGLGIDLHAPAFDGSPQTLPIRVQDVLLVSALLSFAGWGCIAVLERLTARARQAWLVIAVAALVFSLGTPLAGSGVSIANRLVLMLMHLAVGSVLIPAMYRSSPRPTEMPRGGTFRRPARTELEVPSREPPQPRDFEQALSDW